MNKPDVSLLNRIVVPLPMGETGVGWDLNSLGGADQLPYLKGEARQKLASKILSEKTSDYDRDSIEQIWYVWAVRADGNYDLRSELGYERINESRKHFMATNKYMYE